MILTYMGCWYRRRKSQYLKYTVYRIDGWSAMETDAGRAVMMTPATKAKALFKQTNTCTHKLSYIRACKRKHICYRDFEKHFFITKER